MATQAVNKDVGDRAQPQWTWTVSGSVTDPTQIVVKQQDADGVETTVLTENSPSSLTSSSTPLARISQGVFRLNPGVALNEAGYWLFRAEATGIAEAAAPDFLYKVGPSEFYDNATLGTRALVTLQEAKDWLQIQAIDAPDGLELARAVRDISDAFHDEAQREFKVDGTNPQTRTFVVDELGWRLRKVYVGDLAAAPTEVEIVDTDWETVVEIVDAEDMTFHPTVRQSWEPIRAIEFSNDVHHLYPRMRVNVTGTWGFPAVPGKVRQAVLDEIAVTLDRDVEQYTQDLAPVTAGEGSNVVVIGGNPRFLAMSTKALAVAWSYRDTLVG